MLNRVDPRSAARTHDRGAEAANVVPFAPRRGRPAAERTKQAAHPAAAGCGEAPDRYARAGHELVTDLRAGRDPAAALAAFMGKVGKP